jgi:Uma2 family endonuclease
MTEEAYLAAEAKAKVRHEYVDGYVFAMSGSTDAHNVICGNIFSFIHRHLRGSSCRAYINDMKVRIQSARSYYYPDIMVTCEPFDADTVFKRSPVLLIEVLSPSTASKDRREKLIAYQKISELKEYLIVHQKKQQVELYRRISETEWELIIQSGDSEITLESLPKGPMKLPFALIYESSNTPFRVKEGESEYGFGQSAEFNEFEA